MKLKLKQGFTIVELSLALTFVSVLLITVALVTIHILSAYQKGLAIRAVGTVGEELIDEFSRSIAGSASKNVTNRCMGLPTSGGRMNCQNDGGRLYVWHQQTGKQEINVFGSTSTVNKDVPLYGAFCTGHYSYVYRTGYLINYKGDNKPNVKVIYKHKVIVDNKGVKNEVVRAEKINDFKLLKILDQNRKVCAQHVFNNYYKSYEFTTESVDLPTDVKNDSRVMSSDPNANEVVYYIGEIEDKNIPTDILRGAGSASSAAADSDLALYDLTIFQPIFNKATMQNFYSGTFILATISGGVDITGAGDYCTDAPDNLSTDFNYCAINKFNFATRSTGQSRKEGNQ